MKLRSIVLLLDVNPREANNGKSYIQHLKDSLLPIFTHVEPGDCLFLPQKEIEIYDNVGEMVAAVNNFKYHKLLLPKTLGDLLEIVHHIQVEEDVTIFVITDSYQDNMFTSIDRVLLKEPFLNQYNKGVRIHFWGIFPCETSILDLKGSHSNMEVKYIEDITEITTKDFLDRLFDVAHA